ncbi:MAG: hypothetical protein J3Q66DRAFT_402424 [Benniella sp.]|nr:MAG: hypothetical protein J3Q66DRAFT_402424 [Benniella sp.]
MLFNKLIHFVLAVILVLISVASAQTAPYTRRLTIHPKTRFCLLLPQSIGTAIATGIDTSVSWCTSSTSVVRNAKKFPTGFIKSAHYKEGSNGRYTQVTGRIDRYKFGLSSSDQGAQSDPSSVYASYCVGFGYFVQFVEPNANIYCLRCCYDASDCPTNQPDKGCKDVIPGDYS